VTEEEVASSVAEAADPEPEQLAHPV
ncbi:hypothetical protein Tco_0665716, partial [Tanacetum coccineum]